MRYQICVSGAAGGETVERSKDKAYKLGQEIAKRRATLLTGATTGLPLCAAKGFRSIEDRVGSSIGFSPASSFLQHVNTYRLPVDDFDFINFTGMNYVGRDQYLISSAEAVITLGGRIGSLHELVTAVVAGKITAVLTDTGGVADMFELLSKEIAIKGEEKIIFSSNMDELLDEVFRRLDAKHQTVKFAKSDLETGDRKG